MNGSSSNTSRVVDTRTPAERLKELGQVAGVSAAVGAFSGIAGRPFMVWSSTRDYIGVGASRYTVYEAIAKYGLPGWFYNWECAVPKSIWKRLVKGVGYVGIDDTDMSSWYKALGSAVLITGLTTPVDRLTGAYGTNRGTMTFSQVMASVWGKGVVSLYKGAGLDLAKGGVEAVLVHGMNGARKEIRRCLNKSDQETSVGEWLAMTFGGATLKGVLTNWIDVSRSEIQGHLDRGESRLSLLRVFGLLGFRAFFFGGFWARYMVGVMTMAGNYGALWVNDQLK